MSEQAAHVNNVIAETKKKVSKSQTKPKQANKKPNESSGEPKMKYIDMVKEAILQLKSRSRGVSQAAIIKFVMAEHRLELNHTRQYVNAALRKGVLSGELKQIKGKGASGSFALGENAQVKKQKRAPKKQGDESEKAEKSKRMTKNKAETKESAKEKTKSAPKKSISKKTPRKSTVTNKDKAASA